MGDFQSFYQFYFFIKKNGIIYISVVQKNKYRHSTFSHPPTIAVVYKSLCGNDWNAAIKARAEGACTLCRAKAVKSRERGLIFLC